LPLLPSLETFFLSLLQQCAGYIFFKNEVSFFNKKYTKKQTENTVNFLMIEVAYGVGRGFKGTVSSYNPAWWILPYQKIMLYHIRTC